MAVVRTVLPRKGIIEPQHGENYESDLDTNWQIIDSLLQDANDVQTAVDAAGTVSTYLADVGLSGVASGFTLSTSATLTPGLTAGVLYAQGRRYAPASAPSPGAATASATNYLFYNSTAGFYYNLTGTPATSGDAFLGVVVTSGTAVTSVTQATKLYGQVSVSSSAAGNLTVPHLLGRAPTGAIIRRTSGVEFWFQAPTDLDATNLYLVASDAGGTAKVIVW
jgi:hypothetical protein